MWPKISGQDGWHYIRIKNVEISTYPVKGRLFNTILSSQTMQGDGMLLLAIVLLNRGYKISYWFNNDKGQVKDFDYRLFRRK